jgi:hypothetical protein
MRLDIVRKSGIDAEIYCGEKAKRHLAARRLPWPKHAEPKQVFNRVSACDGPGGCGRRDMAQTPKGEMR